jgi:hypothetical protein
LRLLARLATFQARKGDSLGHRLELTCAFRDLLDVKETPMTAKAPPVPRANRSPKGPGGAPETPLDTSHGKSGPDNLEEQGRQGNIAQNTRNQGHQQDR